VQRIVTGLLAALALTFGSPQELVAQDDMPVFTVTYIEVLPSAIERTTRLLEDYAGTAAAESGNLRFQTLARIERPGHFAILEAWADQRARDAHAASSATTRFRSALEPLLYSPYDERPSTPVMNTSGRGGDGEVVVLTHVDFVRTGLEDGLVALEAFVDRSREQPGAVDIGVIIQASRTNHMTLFEVWSNLPSQEANAVAAHSLRYRNAVFEGIGALYDERRYRVL